VQLKKKVIHLRAHPCGWQTDKDWEKLRRLLGYVSEQVSLERLQSITLADLARKVSEKERDFC
jgi:hypothetical protein